MTITGSESLDRKAKSNKNIADATFISNGPACTSGFITHRKRKNACFSASSNDLSSAVVQFTEIFQQIFYYFYWRYLVCYFWFYNRPLCLRFLPTPQRNAFMYNIFPSHATLRSNLTRLRGSGFDLDGRAAPAVLLHLRHPLAGHLVGVVGGAHGDLVLDAALALQLLAAVAVEQGEK